MDGKLFGMGGACVVLPHAGEGLHENALEGTQSLTTTVSSLFGVAMDFREKTFWPRPRVPLNFHQDVHAVVPRSIGGQAGDDLDGNLARPLGLSSLAATKLIGQNP